MPKDSLVSKFHQGMIDRIGGGYYHGLRGNNHLFQRNLVLVMFEFQIDSRSPLEDIALEAKGGVSSNTLSKDVDRFLKNNMRYSKIYDKMLKTSSSFLRERYESRLYDLIAKEKRGVWKKLDGMDYHHVPHVG